MERVTAMKPIQAVATQSRIFSAGRLWATGGIFVVLYATYLILALHSGDWIADRDGNILPTDFVWIWVGARFAWARDAAGAFDYVSFAAAQAPLTGLTHGIFPYYHWIYPPIFMLLIMPLGTLPYVAAYLSWIAVTLGGYLVAIYAIVPRKLALLVALLPINVFETISIGHTGFLLTGLLGLALALGERQPFLAGLVLGFLAYKPQFCLLFPLVLLVAAAWRVLAGAALSCAALVIASTAVFGFQSWILFMQTVRKTDPSSFMPDPHLDAMNQTVFGVLHWLGAPLLVEWIGYSMICVPVVVLVCAVWRQRVGFGLKASALSLGALIVTPYMLNYDLVAAAIPAAFLIREGLETGFLPGEEIAYILCFGGLALTSIMPAGPFVLGLLLALLLRRLSLGRAATTPAGLASSAS